MFIKTSSGKLINMDKCNSIEIDDSTILDDNSCINVIATFNKNDKRIIEKIPIKGQLSMSNESIAIRKAEVLIENIERAYESGKKIFRIK